MQNEQPSSTHCEGQLTLPLKSSHLTEWLVAKQLRKSLETATDEQSSNAICAVDNCGTEDHNPTNMLYGACSVSAITASTLNHAVPVTATTTSSRELPLTYTRTT